MAKIYTRQALLDPNVIMNSSRMQQDRENTLAKNRMDMANEVGNMVKSLTGLGAYMGRISDAEKWYNELSNEDKKDPAILSALEEYKNTGDATGIRNWRNMKLAYGKMQADADASRRGEITKLLNELGALQSAEKRGFVSPDAKNENITNQERIELRLNELGYTGETAMQNLPAKTEAAQPSEAEAETETDNEKTIEEYSGMVNRYVKYNSLPEDVSADQLLANVRSLAAEYPRNEKLQQMLTDLEPKVQTSKWRKNYGDLLKEQPTELKTEQQKKQLELQYLDALQNGEISEDQYNNLLGRLGETVEGIERKGVQQRRESAKAAVAGAATERTIKRGDLLSELKVAKSTLANLQAKWNKLDPMEQKMAKNKNNMNNKLWQDVQKAQDEYDKADKAYKAAGGK